MNSFQCTETKSEKSPWWSVDLLDAYPVKHVRLTTRCCDGVPIKRAEVSLEPASLNFDLNQFIIVVSIHLI